MWLSQAQDIFHVSMCSTSQQKMALKMESKRALWKPIDESCHQLHFRCWALVCMGFSLQAF